jgi:photosynthetic reaction center H subunit
VQAPNFVRDTREIQAERTALSAGSPLEPVGDPMLSGVGSASFAQRADTPELMRDGTDLIVPMRLATGFAVSAGPDPRGWAVVATDGVAAGRVKELWVDRADVMVRYLEVELEGEAVGTRLLPITMLRITRERVEVASLKAEHFAKVPSLKDPDRVTPLEEDQICAFYSSGRRYAEPKRLGPVI